MIIKTLLITTLLYLLTLSKTANSAEIKTRGVIDIRATTANTINSYRDGGYGKFDLNNNEFLSLAQAGGELIIIWDNGISAHIIGNSYSQNTTTKIGLTETFLKYTSLPNSHGYRWQTKLGTFYPELSLENNAIAWSSPNTLNFSTINTWIGEEIRVLGNEHTLTRLGKFHNNNFDVSITAAAFVNNDPAGSLLAWHGWTVGSRQTLLNEKVRLPPLSALQEGGALHNIQTTNVDPFTEIDHNIGWYANTKIKWQGKGQIAIAYYNNNATPYAFSDGQYGWQTRFLHVAGKWLIAPNLTLYSQFMNGDTLMKNSDRIDIVKNDFQSAYIALSKKINQHKITVRIEEFSMTDNDSHIVDNNNEYGKSLTTNYTYRLSRPWFLSAEYSWLKSARPARAYSHAAVKLTEQQLQLAARYFF